MPEPKKDTKDSENLTIDDFTTMIKNHPLKWMKLLLGIILQYTEKLCWDVSFEYPHLGSFNSIYNSLRMVIFHFRRHELYYLKYTVASELPRTCCYNLKTGQISNQTITPHRLMTVEPPVQLRPHTILLLREDINCPGNSFTLGESEKTIEYHDQKLGTRVLYETSEPLGITLMSPDCSTICCLDGLNYKIYEISKDKFSKDIQVTLKTQRTFSRYSSQFQWDPYNNQRIYCHFEDSLCFIDIQKLKIESCEPSVISGFRRLQFEKFICIQKSGMILGHSRTQQLLLLNPYTEQYEILMDSFLDYSRWIVCEETCRLLWIQPHITHTMTMISFPERVFQQCPYETCISTRTT